MNPHGPVTKRWLYISRAFDGAALVEDGRLDGLTERHKVELDPGSLHAITGVREEIERTDPDGVVFEMGRGWAGRTQIADARRLLKDGRSVLFHWPEEQAVEVIDHDRLVAHGIIWMVGTAYRVRSQFRRSRPSGPLAVVAGTGDAVARDAEELARALISGATNPPSMSGAVRGDRVPGRGVYVRSDYWAAITTGGSYGHTCYVAAELAARSDDFVALMANRFGLLDDLGVRQIVLPSPSAASDEQTLLAVGTNAYLALRPLLETLQPAYVYERLCLGNAAAARACADLGIPYIVEYNGSEISMARSFDGSDYEHAATFELLERAAFAQATLISVVSEPVGDSLVARGVDPAKILVNPNGADPAAYRPLEADERDQLRRSLGIAVADRVVGFIGTFGGWHGIDVLAEAIPIVCDEHPDARFLLIGDGAERPRLVEAIESAGVSDRVLLPGRVAHDEAATMLGACDAFVSPHHNDMIDSPFFGSPTKLFEYMAVGKGIVASDLEQIGQVLSPGLRPDDFSAGAPDVFHHRAVLVKPGDVLDLAHGIGALLRHPEISDALGRNAREAVERSYSWGRHVERLLERLGQGAPSWDQAPNDARELTLIDTADAYKDEVQRQWNNNPCGSQYVAPDVEEHTLEWFLEVERYRYEEYGPWMRETLEFDNFGDRDVLEIGAGIGTDHAQFAKAGARVTDYDLSAGHLALAEENFKLRGLEGRFIHGDAEELPFEDDSFDLVFSNGVIHHTPNTQTVIGEIHRVLRPGGRAIIMVYSENSLHYWRNLVGHLGLREGMLENHSIGEIMSRTVEMTDNDARPLVKVYTARRLRRMFGQFEDLEIVRRQMVSAELPRPLVGKVPVELAARLAGWNLVLKARKPAST